MRSAVSDLRNVAATLAVGVACAGAATAVVTSQGCQLQGVCAGEYVDAVPGLADSVNVAPQAGLTDATTWQTGPTVGNWVHFPGGETYRFQTPFRGNNFSAIAWISPDENPSLNNSNFTLAAGNVVEFENFADFDGYGIFWVYNATCADYWLRIVVTEPAEDAGAVPPLDASEDAPTEGALDAPSAPDATLDGGPG